jgi:hypothetical protein
MSPRCKRLGSGQVALCHCGPLGGPSLLESSQMRGPERKGKKETRQQRKYLGAESEVPGINQASPRSPKLLRHPCGIIRVGLLKSAVTPKHANCELPAKACPGVPLGGRIRMKAYSLDLGILTTTNQTFTVLETLLSSIRFFATAGTRRTRRGRMTIHQ